MLSLTRKYYAPWPTAGAILCEHSMQVVQKAQEIARGVPELNPDMEFIQEAAMLHDIGIFRDFEDGPRGARSSSCRKYRR